MIKKVSLDYAVLDKRPQEWLDIIITNDLISFREYIDKDTYLDQNLDIDMCDKHFNLLEIVVNLGTLEMLKIVQ